MRRGEIWTISGGSGYAGKSRPAVIVQSDEFDATLSIAVCLFTTNPAEAPMVRPVVEPSDFNGLRSTSRIMVDKVSSVPKSRLGTRIGSLSDVDRRALDRALLTFLDLVSGSAASVS